MSGKSKVSSEPHVMVKAAAILFVSFLLFYLLGIALKLSVNYFDSISIFMNAKGIAQGGGMPYFWKRPVFLPGVFAVYFFFENHVFTEGFAVLAARSTSVIVFGGLIWISYKIFCLHLSKSTALLGASLIALNRLLIHYAPFVKEDIPGALLTALAFYFYLLSTRYHRKKDYVLVSLFITAAITTRYNLLPLIFLAIAAYEFLRGYTKVSFANNRLILVGENTKRKFILFCLVPLVLFFVIPITLYVYLNVVPFWDAPRKFINEMVYFFFLINEGWEPARLNFDFLLTICGWPLIIMGVIGIVSSLNSRREGALFHILWLGVFLFFQTYMIAQKEARFLFPMFIPFYFFIAAGFSELGQIIDHLFKSPSAIMTKKFIGLAFLIVVYFYPVKYSYEECKRFKDPFYTTNFTQRVAEFADELAEDKQVFWVGKMYPLTPKEFVFHPADKKTYIYDVFNHTMRFYIGRRVGVLKDANFLYPGGGREGIFVQNIGSYTEDGDVLIMSLEPENYTTQTLPKRRTPLTVQKIRKIAFSPAGNNTFVSADLPQARLEVIQHGDSYEVRGQGIPVKHFELYLALPNQMITLTTVEAKNGLFSIRDQDQINEGIQKVFLLYFSDKEEFYYRMDEATMNTIQRGKRVRLSYVLKVDGQIKHSRDEQDPLEFVQGDESILPGLSDRLEGLKEGDRKVIVLPPEDAYGLEDSAAFKEFPRSVLPQTFPLQVGQSLEIELKNGESLPAVISQIKGDTVILNFNSPLAGKTLHYEVIILEVD